MHLNHVSSRDCWWDCKCIGMVSKSDTNDPNGDPETSISVVKVIPNDLNPNMVPTHHSKITPSNNPSMSSDDHPMKLDRRQLYQTFIHCVVIFSSVHHALFGPLVLVSIHPCMYQSTYPSIRQSFHPSIHQSIRQYITSDILLRTYAHAYMHACMHACMHAYQYVDIRCKLGKDGFPRLGCHGFKTQRCLYLTNIGRVVHRDLIEFKRFREQLSAHRHRPELNRSTTKAFLATQLVNVFIPTFVYFGNVNYQIIGAWISRVKSMFTLVTKD